MLRLRHSLNLFRSKCVIRGSSANANLDLMPSTSHRLLHIPLPEYQEKDIIWPQGTDWKLQELPKQPLFTEKELSLRLKDTKQFIYARGPELMFNEMKHQQYGIVALTGGFLTYENLETVRTRINHHIKGKRFAVWNVNAPWLPRTKMTAGARMGGGKGKLKFYVTPVRAGRVIVELGGFLRYTEAWEILSHAAHGLNIETRFMSHQDLLQMQAEEKRVQEMNTNKYSWDMAIKWNMQNCRSWLTYTDIAFRCKYR